MRKEIAKDAARKALAEPEGNPSVDAEAYARSIETAIKALEEERARHDSTYGKSETGTKAGSGTGNGFPRQAERRCP